MKEGRIQGTSRRDEEKHLEETLAVIRKNMEEYGSQIRAMQADIEEMFQHYHDNDPEMYTMLSNTVTLHEHMKRALSRNQKAVNKPYFGRIDFEDKASGRMESLYIGRGGIAKDATHQQVVDWRAPVAAAYYENGLGECQYPAPGGKTVPIDLKRKRTYEIDQGKLSDYYDSEVISNDELLTKYLARNKQAVLGEIVATIQKEQNQIIRRSPYHNTIVQGAAGSGKTTVAMHRISFILYNYAERFRPEDFYIVGSNRILLNYITGVLPDLDVYGVRQMTMEQLFTRLLYEDWDEKKDRVKAPSGVAVGQEQRGSAGWFADLKKFCDELERSCISTESVTLDPGEFAKSAQSAGNKDSQRILLVDGASVERYLSQNPGVSIQGKINQLNDRLRIKIQEVFLNGADKYTEEEKKAILKAYRNRYGGRIWKRPIRTLYLDFLTRQKDKGFPVELPDREYDVYDLAALAYLYKRAKETEVISEARHIVIDEAQDFGMMIYHCLDACIRGCTYTVMGDVSQNIHFGVGLNEWEPLRKLLLPDPMDHFDVLRKSYRNTVEISEFAARILRHGHFYPYPAKPIIRHGKAVRVEQAAESQLYDRAAAICGAWQEEGLGTIALILRNEKQAKAAGEILASKLRILETDPEKTEFANGVMVLSVEYTKGLEFDACLILDPTREDYPIDDGHARLLYVAATRALHELCVLYTGRLTGLIEDPPPEPGAENCRALRDALPKPVREESAAGKPADAAKAAPRPRPKAVPKLSRDTSETPDYARLRTSYAAQPKTALPKPSRQAQAPVEDAAPREKPARRR